MFSPNNLRDICDAMHDAIVVADRASLRVLYTNQAILKLTGFSESFLSQISLTDLYTQSHHANITNLASLINGRSVYFEAPLRTANSPEILSETQVTAGQIEERPCLICVVRDISHRTLREKELRKREAIYRSLVEAMPDLVFRIRRDGTYLEFKLPDNLGLKIPEDDSQIIGKKIADLMPEHVTEMAMLAIERAFVTGEMQAIEYQIEEPSGFHHYEARFVTTGDDEVVALVRDTTELKRNETLLRLQRDLSVALSVETNLYRALQLVVDTAIRLAGMDCGGIYLVNPQSGMLELAFHQGLSEEFVQQVSCYGPEAVRARLVPPIKPIYTDFEKIGLPLNETHRRERLQAMAVVPVLHEDNVIGCINIASHSAYQVPAPARDALETIASHIGSAIARIRADEARRESEKTTRALLNASRDMAMLLDRDLTILAVNEPAAHWLGHAPDALIGTSLLNYLSLEEAQARQAAAEKVLRSGQPAFFQNIDQDRYFDHAAHPLLNTQNEVIRLAVFVRDITEQKRVEEALLHKDRLLEALAQATSRLMTTGDQETIFNDALGLLGEAADVDQVFIYESHLHPDTGEPVASYRYGWASDPYSPEVSPAALQNLRWQAYGLQSWYDTLAAGKEIKMSFQERAALGAARVPIHRIKSLILAPVFVNNEFWGIIGFDDRRKDREWSGDEISALRTMATGFGTALERQQVEARLRREREMADYEREVADTLREVGMALTSSLELDKVLGQIMEQARRVVPYKAANVFLLEDGIARMVYHVGYEAFGLSDGYMNQIKHPLDQMPIMQIIMREGTPYLSPDVEMDANWHAFPGFEWVQSWLGAPVVVRGEVAGVFSFDSAQKDFYSEEHVRLIAPFARQAAIAIENALLFEDTQRLERIKSEMIRMASHDLRSPLTRINETLRRFRELPTSAEIVNMDSGTVDHDEFCAILSDAAHEMEQIIANILSLERIEALHRATRTIVWCELLAESVGTVRAELEAKHHRLSVECESNLPVTHGDPLQLQRAMSNLIGNAIKYTPPGGHIKVRIYRSSYGGTPTVAFEVRDNGIGIPQELQEQLFQPFYRAEQTGAENVPGLGLGLSIVKAAIKYHKGNVYVDSVPGQGSLFGFWVPA
jgi:PAS domain S-box-containing protein